MKRKRNSKINLRSTGVKYKDVKLEKSNENGRVNNDLRSRGKVEFKGENNSKSEKRVENSIINFTSEQMR